MFVLQNATIVLVLLSILTTTGCDDEVTINQPSQEGAVHVQSHDTKEMTVRLPYIASRELEDDSQLDTGPQLDTASEKTFRRQGKATRPTPKVTNLNPANPSRRATASKSATKVAKSTCDEVTCLLSPNEACCTQHGKKTTSHRKSSDLPVYLGRRDLMLGVSKIRSKVNTCKKHGSGIVTVPIAIGGDGRVRELRASGGNKAMRDCVTRAVESAVFKKSQKGALVNYPFRL